MRAEPGESICTDHESAPLRYTTTQRAVIIMGLLHDMKSKTVVDQTVSSSASECVKIHQRVCNFHRQCWQQKKIKVRSYFIHSVWHQPSNHLVSFHLCPHRPPKSWNSTTTRSSSAPSPVTPGCSWGRGWTRASPTPTTQPWVRPSLSSVIYSYLTVSVFISEWITTSAYHIFDFRLDFSLRLISVLCVRAWDVLFISHYRVDIVGAVEMDISLTSWWRPNHS